MSNEYLRQKWRLWHQRFDVNHDGETNMLDMQYARDEYLKLGQVPLDKRSLVTSNIERWWRKYRFWGQSGITADQFVNYMNTAFIKDKEKFVALMKECFEMAFDFAETGKESVTENEFVAVFKAAGHRNEGLDRSFFQAYDPVSGKVPLQTLVDSWLVFMTSENPRVPDIVMQAFHSGF